MLDTGVGIFLITEPDIAKYFDPGTARTIKINGIGEQAEMIASIYPSAKVQFSKSISGNIPVAILKEDPFNLSAYLGMPVHGLAGYEIFNSFKIKLNYATQTIIFYKPDHKFIPRKGSPVSISVEDRKAYLKTELVMPGNKNIIVKLIIDTGAGHPLSLETWEGASFVVPERNISANLGVGLSGTISGFLSRVPSIKLGKYDLNNLICAFPDYESVAAKVYSVQRDGSLGNNILKRFNVLFDYSRQIMYLKPNYMFKEPFEHDMSGIEILTDGPDYDKIMVHSVVAGSAADLAGLEANDRIISINFKKANELGIEQINNILRSKDGRQIVFEIENAKGAKFVILALKRRI